MLLYFNVNRDTAHLTYNSLFADQVSVTILLLVRYLLDKDVAAIPSKAIYSSHTFCVKVKME